MLRLLVFILALTFCVGPVSAEDQATPTIAAQHEIEFLPYKSGVFRSHCSGFNYESAILPWLGMTEQKIRRSGFEDDVFKKKHISIRIIPNKAVGQLDLIQSSGSKSSDAAAMDILRKASPFQKPAIGLEDGRPMIVEFDYPRLELRFLGHAAKSYYLGIDPYLPRPIDWRVSRLASNVPTTVLCHGQLGAFDVSNIYFSQYECKDREELKAFLDKDPRKNRIVIHLPKGTNKHEVSNDFQSFINQLGYKKVQLEESYNFFQVEPTIIYTPTTRRTLVAPK
jgi:hypothetical protein